MPSPADASPGSPALAPGPSLGTRLGVSLVVAAVVYVLGLYGTPADPRLWPARLPANDSITLETLKSEIDDVNQRLLEEHLRTLDRENYGTASRKLLEFVSRFPRLRFAVAGVLIRRAEGLIAGKQLEAAKIVAQGAVSLADQDWRAWRTLEEVHRLSGETVDADRAGAHARERERSFPVPDGQDYALGLGAPLLAMLVPFLLLPRLVRGSSAGAATSHPSHGADGESTIVGVAAPDLGDLVNAEEAPGGQVITRVLNAEGRLEQARLFIEVDQWDEVLSIFKAAVKLNPAASKKVCTICVEEGRKLYEAGDMAKAQRCFQVGVEFEAREKNSHTYLANCMVKQGNFEAAVDHYLEVCSIDPQGAIGFYNLGICYEKTQQPEQAVKAFEHALRLDATMANAHYYLAKIQETRGALPASLAHWQKVIQMSPGTPQAQRAQERVTAIQQAIQQAGS